MMNKSILLFSLLVLLSCSLRKEKHYDKADNNFSILFIGNSLTYTNDLPELVKKSALSKGVNVKTEMIARPNFAIADHWTNGQVRKRIASGNYDFVVIQQGPSSQTEGRKMLIENGKDFQNLCESNNTKLCYFMVWPSLSYYHTFDGVIKNYRDAATMNNAILLPVGEVWKTYIDSTGNYDYYSQDGFHPSLKGSQIAAQSIVETLIQNLKNEIIE